MSFRPISSYDGHRCRFLPHVLLSGALYSAKRFGLYALYSIQPSRTKLSSKIYHSDSPSITFRTYRLGMIPLAPTKRKVVAEIGAVILFSAVEGAKQPLQQMIYSLSERFFSPRWCEQIAQYTFYSIKALLSMMLVYTICPSKIALATFSEALRADFLASSFLPSNQALGEPREDSDSSCNQSTCSRGLEEAKEKDTPRSEGFSSYAPCPLKSPYFSIHATLRFLMLLTSMSPHGVRVHFPQVIFGHETLGIILDSLTSAAVHKMIAKDGGVVDLMCEGYQKEGLRLALQLALQLALNATYTACSRANVKNARLPYFGGAPFFSLQMFWEILFLDLSCYLAVQVLEFSSALNKYEYWLPAVAFASDTFLYLQIFYVLGNFSPRLANLKWIYCVAIAFSHLLVQSLMVKFPEHHARLGAEWGRIILELLGMTAVLFGLRSVLFRYIRIHLKGLSEYQLFFYSYAIRTAILLSMRYAFSLDDQDQKKPKNPDNSL